jgi:hypothetical protein
MKRKCELLKANIGKAKNKRDRGKALYKYMSECRRSALRRFGKKRRGK